MVSTVTNRMSSETSKLGLVSFSGTRYNMNYFFGRGLEEKSTFYYDVSETAKYYFRCVYIQAGLNPHVRTPHKYTILPKRLIEIVNLPIRIITT